MFEGPGMGREDSSNECFAATAAKCNGVLFLPQVLLTAGLPDPTLVRFERLQLPPYMPYERFGDTMQITKNAVVAIDYTLTSDEGEVLDTSEGHEPLVYLHGVGGIIPGLECELEGKQVGDQFQVTVAPAEGYGERDDTLEQEVARDQFEGDEDLALGMQFQVESEEGPTVVTVIEIDDDVVTIDGNHPMAGVNLNFDVTIREVRQATDDELSHGHVHGMGGCEH